ncbi:mitotic checkpoint regulator, MAD2B-interacting-domain-containing protein [Hypoxylon rubiginosum]|uniref:Mitotic checkpoint regulator, MAD2B-interacting-domain-containing protein n=1 Tax=Hypoxylon rubiginosum TaxID=110542 RepID=A0ACB9YPT4_9PEZI|nr:mitotic checkpoint regulator, MAD2B-interacting-domain-containing protein [Hypoxylon rubiginosum]
MGLVDYSDSESDSEPVAQPAPAPAPAPAATTASGKKPFQKIIDRSQPGKIRVSLPQTSGPSKATDGDEDRPLAKRARVAGGGGAFSGFNSFLPPPKNIRKPTTAAAASGSGKAAPRPGINLKTGAAPGFSREADEDGEGGGAHDETRTSGGDVEPPAKQPSIPAEQKPADEVKLVGKPLMFRPLSVSRKPGKKNAAKSAAVSKAVPAPAPQTSETSKAKREAETTTAGPPPPKKQRISLFSIPNNDEPADAAEDPAPSSNNGVYEPMFGSNEEPDEFAAYDQQYTSTSTSAPPNPTAHTTTTTTTSSSLDAVATSMNLSASARRELFGRSGAPSSASARQNVITFDTTKEYAHNEALRASGEANQQPAFNPLRALAPGKHSLRQLVTQAQSHREALEDSFAQGKSHRGEAGARYGWR